MNKVLYLFIFVIFVSCLSRVSKKHENDFKSDSLSQIIVDEKNVAGFTRLDSGDFKALIDFIISKKSKILVPGSNIPYLYIDKKDNHHLMVLNEKSQVISVLVKEAKTDRDLYFYIISPEGLSWSDEADSEEVLEATKILISLAKK